MLLKIPLLNLNIVIGKLSKDQKTALCISVFSTVFQAYVTVGGKANLVP